MSREIDYTQPLSEDEARYVHERPWIEEDLRLQGVEIQWPKDDSEPEAEEEESDDEEIDYADLSVEELKAELKSRQEEGRPIAAASTKKADLIAALEQDDVQAANSFDANYDA